MSARQPWLLFMPDGTFDGMVWSPETIEKAQKWAAYPKGARGWKAMERAGWTIRRGVDDEHKALTEAAIKAHR